MSVDEFLTVENMKHLLEIMTDVFHKKYNIEMESLSHVNVKDVFLNVMKKVDGDPENAQFTLDQKNIITLRIVREILRTHARSSVDNADRSPMLREKDLNHSRKTTLFEPSQQAFASNPDVVNKMKEQEDLRKLENRKEAHTWNGEGIQDERESEDVFKDKIASLENLRSDFDKQLQDIFDNRQGDGQDFIEKRNESMSSILNKNPSDVDPTAFFKQNNEINQFIHEQHPVQQDPPTFQNLAESTIIKKQDFHDSRLEKKYILINSYDRNWITDKQRYKYKVRFSYSTNDVLRVPYYENNPTVPFTKTEKSPGIRNDFGWVDTNGIFHEKYDPEKPLSSITDADGKMVELGYEEVEIVVDQDASMIGTFKNIHSIQITNVSIPTDIFQTYVTEGGINPLQVDGTQYYNYNFNFPYILCNIDEFQDVYDGTDDTIRKTFCQLQYDNFVKTPNGRGYIILKPVQNERKIFHPNPLSTLPTMNISLVKPNGELLNNSEDGLSIFTVNLIQNFYLKVVTREYFDKNAFYHGDYVRIKNFNIYQINSDLSKENIDRMNSFVNKPEGHVVFEIGDPNESGYYNSFHIFAPGQFDKSIGKFVVDSTLTDTLTLFNNHLIENDFFATGNDMNKDFENGFLINMSLQNSISVTVEMYKPEAMGLAE